MAKKSVEKTSEFDRLTKILVQKEAQIRELEEANAVIAKWRSLQEDKDGVIDQLKIEARKLISAPGTQVLIDSAEVAISVTMHQPPVTFDFEKAKKLWPAAIVEKSRVVELDKKRVEQLISLGDLSPTLAAKAEVVGKSKTPAVTIRLG